MTVIYAEDKIDTWFPTSIYVSTQNCVTELDNIKTACYSICEKEEVTNPWLTSQLKTSFHDETNGKLWLDDRFANLGQTILEKAKNFGLNIGYSPSTTENFEFTNMWANIIGPHDYHAFHTHSTTGSAIISGVYYVDAPEKCDIQFRTPYDQMHIATVPETLNELNYVICSYPCRPGTIYLWKSNVSHGYDAHNQEQDKISIAFNIQVKQQIEIVEKKYE